MRALQYVEIDVDFCSLAYSVSPCRAQLGYQGLDDGTAPYDAFFDGSNDWLTRDAGLSGAADSKTATLSFWIRRRDSSVSRPILAGNTTLGGGSGTQRSRIQVGAAGEVAVVATNAAGTTIYNCSGGALPVLEWVHVLCSFDLTNPARNHFYVNDVNALATTTFTNDTVDWTLADWAIAAHPDGGSKLFADLADLWFFPGVYLDLSVEANRRKFVSADVRPVPLGSTGQFPTGSSSLVLMADVPSNWQNNLGTGGPFTEHGHVGESEFFASGHDRCFNTLRTCQDRENFTQVPLTLRFVVPTAYLPNEIEAIPSIKSISFDSATVSLGQNLGQRAAITVTFEDHKHSDTGLDPYVATRLYDPWSRGTFFGKFRARVPFLRGRSLRWINGEVGQALSEMETRHYVIDSFSGPTNSGEYVIVAKDVLKLADSDRAVAPRPNTGFLSADITDVAVTATLLPSGIGDAEYPVAAAMSPPAIQYWVAIGGNEIVGVTARAGDVLTITRGQLNTPPSAHAAQDRVQLVLRYVGADPADIVSDLLTNYAGVPSSYVPLSQWQQETATYLNRLYSADIAQPTSVSDLLSEIIEQAGLALWWRDREQTIGLVVLRGSLAEAAALNQDNVLERSLDIEEQPDKRLSSIHTYFGQINPLNELSEKSNWRSLAVLTDAQAESDYGSAAIKEIFARWIPANGRTVADRINSLQMARFKDPPRRFRLRCLRGTVDDLALVKVYNLFGWPIQSDTGEAISAPFQVTRLRPMADVIEVEGEEMLFSAPAEDLANRKIVIDTSTLNFNARTTHDLLYPTPDVGDVVTVTINAGVIVGSSTTASPAFDVGSWPTGVSVVVNVNGRIEGCGGDAVPRAAGRPGGVALFTRAPISLNVGTGQIWGGGGGGGSAFGGGGGGAGQLPGHGASVSGADGTTEAGGAAATTFSSGGNGGNPGLPGAASSFFLAGGAAGSAIDGISFVTVTSGPGDRRGPEVN